MDALRRVSFGMLRLYVLQLLGFKGVGQVPCSLCQSAAPQDAAQAAGAARPAGPPGPSAARARAQAGIHIVTPNKKLNSGPLPQYQALRQFQRGSYIHFFYEARPA